MYNESSTTRQEREGLSPIRPPPAPPNSWPLSRGISLASICYPAIVKPPRLLFIPLALLLPFFLPDLATSALAQKKATASAVKKPAAKAPASTAKSASARTASKKSASGKSSAGARGRRSVVARRSATQQQPDSERIREIQEALAAKGYPVDPSGVWGQQSVDALKKFQQDQNINNMSGRGKLDSLTLIALGLGPRRGTPSPGTGSDSKATEGKTP